MTQGFCNKCGYAGEIGPRGEHPAACPYLAGPLPEAVAMQPIPSRDDNPNGFHQRYVVSKTSGEPVDPRAVYLVLRLDEHGDDEQHTAFCRAAAREYCERVFRMGTKHPLSQMATELWSLLNDIEARIGN